jgi:hypothetical protein
MAFQLEAGGLPVFENYDATLAHMLCSKPYPRSRS